MLLSRTLRTALITRQFTTSRVRLAGHAKWQNIKHRKERQDASRSSRFTKIAHQIYIAAREGGSSDPLKNVRLTMAIENASRSSVPKKVIEAAVARAEKSADNLSENALSINYEGVGPGGVAFIVETLTDNKNRTAQQVRALFLKYKGSLSPTSYMFDRRGWLELNIGVGVSYNTRISVDSVFDNCVDVPGVVDIEAEEDSATVIVYTDASSLNQAATTIGKMYRIVNMGLRHMPKEELRITSLSEDDQVRFQKLATELDALDDVCDLYTNYVED